MKRLLARSATLLFALVFFITATGCQQLLNEIPFPRRTALATQPEASPQATLTHDMQKTELPAVVEDKLDKIIFWLPPAFDPENGSSAGRRIQERLQAFRYDHPEVTIEVRVKALSGPGSLLDSLSAATLAAPAVVPGLLILPHADLAIAVSQGLIVPVEAEQNQANQADHFAFAEDLVRVNGLDYGLPFAADVFCLAYKNQQVAYPPVYWQEVIQLGKILAFPAGEAQDAQQADKDVVQRDIQADRGANVVGFTTADDVAGLEQDGARRDQDEHRANRQVQRRQLQEQVSDHTNQHHHDAGHQHTAEERHVFARRQHVGRAAEEDQRRTAQRQAD